MLMPKRVKRRRVQKGRIKGNAVRGTRINFGDFGIKALEIGRITSRQIEAAQLPWISLFLPYKWPSSVAYALDILAWDWFFALSMLFAAPVFKGGKLEKMVRILMIVSGVLCLVGLLGVPFADMLVLSVGILGYGVVAPVVFLLLAVVFGRTQPMPGDTERNRSA